MDAMPKVSIIIPVKDEEDNIVPLADEITEVLGSDPSDIEILFVDDGSTDKTLERIKQKAEILPTVHWISFDKNHGQTAAFDAGLRQARGKILVMMDGDLQNDPRDIPRLIEGLDSADMVGGFRVKRQDSVVRLISSKIANTVRNWVTHEDIIDVGCSLRAMKRECIERVKLFEGMHRFFPTLIKLEGFSTAQIPVNHRPRRYGRAKYGISNRMFKALMDLFAVVWMQHRHLNYVIRERG